ncbi:MAG: methylenetetrahydrofolate reductase [Flavobacteriales bacterium]|nr:methylenetetrahydrofolate reductase [Flavobacteriales bacterium]
MLKDKILNREAGILLYGMTPPKENTDIAKVSEIASKHMDRIKSLDIDGVVLYDIQDESARNEDARPFPFLPTFEPQKYSGDFLEGLDLPKVLFQVVGKHDEVSLRTWMNKNVNNGDLAVFIGNSSSAQATDITMNKAFSLRSEYADSMLIGGVAIPERHYAKKDEHLRIASKINNGVSFFTTQAVYNVEASKNMLSEYYYHSKKNNLPLVPIMMTFSPCGSTKTMDFMKWLGIHFPKWLKNDLTNSQDILGASIDTCVRTFTELVDFSLKKGIPIGANIESVSIRKDEIDASVELLENVKDILNKKL